MAEHKEGKRVLCPGGAFNSLLSELPGVWLGCG